MITSIPSKDPSLPLLSPEGCGQLIIARQRIGGTQEVGGPGGASRKQAMTYVMVHFSHLSCLKQTNPTGVLKTTGSN